MLGGAGEETQGEKMWTPPKSLEVVLTVGLYRKCTAWCACVQGHGTGRVPQLLKKRDVFRLCDVLPSLLLPAQALPGI